MKINTKFSRHYSELTEPMSATLPYRKSHADLTSLVGSHQSPGYGASKSKLSTNFLRSTLNSNRSSGESNQGMQAMVENAEKISPKKKHALPDYVIKAAILNKPELEHKPFINTKYSRQGSRARTQTYKQISTKISTPGTQNKFYPQVCRTSHQLYERNGHFLSSSQQHIQLPNPQWTAVNKGKTCLQDFQIIKHLGNGNFGQVYLVCHKKTNALFALKKIKKETVIKNKMEEQLLMEIKMQSFLCHPNILKLYGFFNDADHIFLILEAMEEGTLYNHLKKQKTLKESDASKKMRDIIDGIEYLHERNIAHRDIKPENILISNDVCKICDLGWAALCDDRRTTLCGTIDYVCPELLEGKEYGIAIDLWCLGVLCFELTVGKAPFYHLSRKQTMKKIMRADSSDINISSNVPYETQDFINRLLLKNPEERMNAEEALLHPLILKYKDNELEEFRYSLKKKN